MCLESKYCEAYRHTAAKLARLVLKLHPRCGILLSLSALPPPPPPPFPPPPFRTKEPNALQAFPPCTCHKTPTAAAGFQHELDSVFIIIINFVIMVAG